jgi:hypothetical protein
MDAQTGNYADRTAMDVLYDKCRDTIEHNVEDATIRTIVDDINQAPFNLDLFGIR